MNHRDDGVLGRVGVRLGRTLLVVALAAVSCGEEEGGHPRIRLERTTVSMHVRERGIAAEEVLVSNDGEADLEVSRVATSLSWVGASPTALSVPPRGEGRIVLTATPTSVGAGTYQGRVVIESNDPDQPSVSLGLSVTVVEGSPPSITVTPTSFILALAPSEEGSVTCTVTNRGGTPGGVTSVTAGCDWVSASPQSLELDPGASGSLTFLLRAGSASGIQECTVQLLTTESTAAPRDVKISLTVGSGGGVPRVVVAEEFTGTWCQYCPGAMMGLQELKRRVGMDRLTVVAYHLADPFAIQAGADRATLYGVSGIPHVWFDGTVDRLGGRPDAPIDYTPQYSQRASVPAPLVISLSLSSYDPPRGDGRIEVTCKNLRATGVEARLVAVMTALDSSYVWQGFDHLYHTAIACFATRLGQPVSLGPNETRTVEVAFETPTGWRSHERELVVFAQDASRREVLQGATLRLP